MKKIVFIGIITMLCAKLLPAGHPTSRVLPLSKAKFAVLEKVGTERVVDLTGQGYIVASLREKGADGAAMP